MAVEKQYPKPDTGCWPEITSGCCVRFRTPYLSSMASTELKPNLWGGQNLMSLLGSLQSRFPRTKHKHEVVVRRLYCSSSSPLTALFVTREQHWNNFTGGILVALDADSPEVATVGSGSRFSSTFITPNSPAMSSSKGAITFPRVCHHAPNVHPPRLTDTFFCSGGRRKTGPGPERR